MALREIIGVFLEGILAFITVIVSFILMVVGRERKTSMTTRGHLRRSSWTRHPHLMLANG
ncbi:MAG: hypothetical protein ACLQRH_23335 [Acidimicrobiales bacterium]